MRKYCPNCKKSVETVKEFNILAFFVGLLFFGVGGLLYLLYYWLFKRPKCPLCGTEL